MSSEVDVLTAPTSSLILAVLRTRTDELQARAGEGTLAHVRVARVGSQVEVEVLSLHKLRPEEGGPEEIGKMQMTAYSWRGKEVDTKDSIVFTNPGTDIIFDMEPWNSPVKFLLNCQQKAEEEADEEVEGCVVVEVHRVSKMPGRSNHLLGEVVVMIPPVAKVQEEQLEVTRFRPVAMEGEEGTQLSARTDNMAKAFLARYKKPL